MQREEIGKVWYHIAIMAENKNGGELFSNQETEQAKEKPIRRFYRTKTVRNKETGVERTVKEKWVSVMGVELPVYEGPDGSTFTDEEFADFSKDEASLDLLKRYAVSANLNQPVLLEGVTDIGKSKALEFLAHLCNRRLFRLSFSGQTDVSEFVGKFVPNTNGARGAFEKILKNHEQLSKQSKQIVDRVKSDGRGFTESECRDIANDEGLSLGDDVKWIWQDGYVINAMTHDRGRGSWLYLDELGAVEPQVIIKLNRIFEDKPRLEIAEDGNRTISAGADFRIFASTNPPEYSGRNPFAPDYLRRFVYQKLSRLKPRVALGRLLSIFTKKRPDVKNSMEKIGVLPPAPLDFEHHEEGAERLFEILVEIETQVNSALQKGDLLRDQRQKFELEFTNNKRIGQFLESFGGANIEKAFQVALELYVYSKFGSDEDRTVVKKIVETVMKGKNAKDVFKKFSKTENESDELAAARVEAEKIMATLDLKSITSVTEAGERKPESAPVPPELHEALESALTESKEFFASHESTHELAEALPSELPPLSEVALVRLKEAREQGFDRMMVLSAGELFPSDATKRAEIITRDLLPLAKYVNDPFESDAAVMRASTPRNRPESGLYILCYSSNPIPQETKNQKYPDLDRLFEEKNWNGFTYQEYLIIQRREAEKRGETEAGVGEHHTFDGYNDDAEKSNWGWLLDSRAPAGVLRADWDPDTAGVYARWNDASDSAPRLGARPAVIVPIF